MFIIIYNAFLMYYHRLFLNILHATATTLMTSSISLAATTSRPVLIPLPPLHTILLGPVNHIIDNLKLLYPELENILKFLHIVNSNYHTGNLEGKRKYKTYLNT